MQDQPSAFLRPADLRILRRLAADRRYAATRRSDYSLSRVEGRDILDLMLNTGRCRLGDVNGPALRVGTMRPAKTAWAIEADGTQRLRFETDGNATVIATLSPPWFLDDRHVS